MTVSLQSTAPLKFVLLCNSQQLERWQEDSIRQAIETGSAELVGIVVRNPDAPPSTSDRWSKRWRERRLMAWRAFDRFCVRSFSQAIRVSDQASITSGARVHRDTPTKVGKFSEQLHPSTIAFIREAKPDFILRFGYGILAGEVLSLARYGVWSYHHGDPENFRGQPPGFWEMYTGAKVAGVILQVLGSKLDAGHVLHRGYFPITRHSYARTRDTLYFGATPFLARACNDIRANGYEGAGQDNLQPLGKIYKQPTNRVMIGFIAKLLAARVVSFARYKFKRQSWNCAVIPDSIEVVAGLKGAVRQAKALKSAIWMTPARKEFYADPFGLKVAPDKYQIFYERFSWPDRRGDISSCTFDGSRFSEKRTSLDTGKHLSYPYVSADTQSAGILPEHSEASDVSFYTIGEDRLLIQAAPAFPESAMIDTSIVKFDEKFWAFALVDSFVKNTHLFLFWSESLNGPWTPHMLNPVKSDVQSSRPGGTPFIHEERLFRPSQDCSLVYGGSVTINEIVTLTPTQFLEVKVSSLEPALRSRYGEGLHTLSSLGDFTLIDGARREFGLG